MSRAINFALAALMLAAVWGIDRFVAGEASTSILYLIPVGYAAWYCGGSWSYAMSLMSAAAWLQADIAVGRPFSHWYIPYWNATVRLGFFVIVAALARSISRLRELVDREREVSQLKSNMVALVSHEFGSSLTMFRLSLDLLKETEPDPSSARHTFYGTLGRVYAHLNNAVENFLNLHRIESGRFEAHLRHTGLKTLVHEVVAQLGPVIDSKPIRLRLDLPDSSVAVRADPDALSVVLSNLLGNALKYTPEGGTISIHVSAPRSGSVDVCVEDTGIGIAAEELERVTAGYYRGERGRKMAKGFGVGLRVVRELLESQGSRLEIDSEPGRGSRFSFRLPVWPPPLPPAAPPSAPRRHSPKPREKR